MIGEFIPGQRLTLPELAESFGTSQMPVREATNRLIVARAIEGAPRRSLRVPEATIERLEMLLPLRLQLEGEATRLAVRRGCSGIVTELKAINAEMDVQNEARDIKTYLRLNQRFHFAVYKQCGNSDLVDLIELLWMRYGPLLNVVRSTGALSRTGYKWHAEIVDGIIENSPDKAAVALRADIFDAAEAIREPMTARDQASQKYG